MQRTKIMMVLGSLALLSMAGCGADDGSGTPESTDAALFVGRWSYQAGAHNRMTCSGQTREVSLVGNEVIERGDSAPLAWVSESFGCRFEMRLDGNTAHVVPFQTCRGGSGANTGVVTLENTSFELGADQRSLTESGTATVRFDDGRTCTGVFGGTLVLP